MKSGLKSQQRQKIEFFRKCKVRIHAAKGLRIREIVFTVLFNCLISYLRISRMARINVPKVPKRATMMPFMVSQFIWVIPSVFRSQKRTPPIMIFPMIFCKLGEKHKSNENNDDACYAVSSKSSECFHHFGLLKALYDSGRRLPESFRQHSRCLRRQGCRGRYG